MAEIAYTLELGMPEELRYAHIRLACAVAPLGLDSLLSLARLGQGVAQCSFTGHLERDDVG